jgi:predicted lipoprotein with Yx(FWY)xxD motif
MPAHTTSRDTGRGRSSDLEDLVKRLSALLMGVLVLAITASALAHAAGPPAPARSALFSSAELRRTKVGKILTNSAGSILFEFSKDHPKKDTCVKISGCSQVWLPAPVTGKPSAGAGVRASLLSSTKLPAGGSQLTYAGHPLYIYEPAPTLTSYIGAKQFGGSWYALNTKGQAVR